MFNLEGEPIIITYAIAFELNDENNYRSLFSENKILKIDNIESFYNYSNLDNDFKLKTAVLSDKISFEYSDETIKAKKSKTKENEN